MDEVFRDCKSSLLCSYDFYLYNNIMLYCYLSNTKCFAYFILFNNHIKYFYSQSKEGKDEM